MSDTKPTAVDVAFKKWLIEQEADKPLAVVRYGGAYEDAYLAGFAERGRMDVEAVEGEQMVCIAGHLIRTQGCVDCAYRDAIDDARIAIRAIDGGGK